MRFWAIIPGVRRPCVRRWTVAARSRRTYHTLSVALYKQEKYAEAESFARQVVQMKPDFVKALLNLGLILQAQARLEDALQIYARANQLDPGNAVIAFKIGVIYKKSGEFCQGGGAVRYCHENGSHLRRTSD